jgi:hypothetical protein
MVAVNDPLNCADGSVETDGSTLAGPLVALAGLENTALARYVVGNGSNGVVVVQSIDPIPTPPAAAFVLQVSGNEFGSSAPVAASLRNNLNSVARNGVTELAWMGSRLKLIV